MTAAVAPTRRLHRFLISATLVHRRLIGLALLRILVGTASVWYYLSDLPRRALLWGPTAIVSPEVASHNLGTGRFSLYLLSGSEAWFETLFFTGLAVSVLFTVCGGRVLSVLQLVLLLSLYLRNEMLMEGGDNLAEIVLLVLPLTVSNAYFSPGARRRRSRLAERTQPSYAVLLHNVAATFIVVQIVVLYVTAGVWKAVGPIWRHGQAMYYVSADAQFSMFSAFHTVMSVPAIGWFVCWFTIVIEVAFPLALLSRWRWIRELEVAALEGMHIGIMVFMGLVGFGLIMVGADFMALRDEDYLSARDRVVESVSRRRHQHTAPTPASAPLSAMVARAAGTSTPGP